MIAAQLLLLLASATPPSVALHVEDLGELAPAVLHNIADRIAGEIERRTRSPVLRDPDVSECGVDHCLPAIRSRFDPGSTVVASVFKSLSVVRVETQRYDRLGARTSSASVDLVADAFVEEGAPEIAELVARLFAGTTAAHTDSATAVLPGGTTPRLLWPIVAGGVGVLALVGAAVGSGFASSTRQQIEGPVLYDREFLPLDDRLHRENIAVAALLGVGAAALGGALVLWLSSD